MHITDDYYHSWPHISRDSLHARKKRKKGRNWQHRMAWIITFADLDGSNHDVGVKHLMTQPGNAPKARLSQRLTQLTRSLRRTRLWRPQRRPSKDADPELRHSKCLTSVLFLSSLSALNILYHIYSLSSQNVAVFTDRNTRECIG